MSRQANRSGELKNTVTLQRRPGRTSTMQSRLTSSQIQSLQRQESVEPNDIPKRLATVYVPDGFDQGSGLLVCNFPAGSSAADCRNFFSWYGPVIYVEYAPTVAGESNFVVVFAAPDFTTVSTARPTGSYSPPARKGGGAGDREKNTRRSSPCAKLLPAP
eukprot:GHVT01063450.1.p1 GENE.GHVT01063450.1~~GHVT01063450.1.p1  ORF type:complete len:160 (+),score=16.70 GHVT01063450.1:1335-1814(+)